ncbi:glycogen phosphorylase [Chromatiales bacterium (ex Bugula neritina AB1)]|nr:glycogen phosphorylase [Chromatiales bacterium (ex Bugula neritina AB1)]
MNNLTPLSPLAMDSSAIDHDFRRHLSHTLGSLTESNDQREQYEALALTVRDRLMERWTATRQRYLKSDCRHAYYLSLEFLMGRALGNATLNLKLEESVKEALYAMGIDLETLQEQEADAGLGNGGLGRLAACFLDSCATLELPVTGYGIRYEYGMFRQQIHDGAQIEEPDHWLREGYVWEVKRPQDTRRIKFGGRSEFYVTAEGASRVRWVDTEIVLAVPHDTPVPGFENNTVNTLRLWKATASDEFELGEFNAGRYTESVASKNEAEHISMVLYPNDSSENGKELRLRQQYFLASASLQDVLAKWVATHGNKFDNFIEKNCFQLNDTHPSIAVAELMRLLMDDHELSWNHAWEITSQTMAYTNHTLLPEALERWSVSLFRHLLPRIVDIIFEINARFLHEVALKWPGDSDRQRRLSIIEEGAEPQVRMAFLAIAGSFSVNGVAALHTDLLKQGLFSEFYELWPHKFNNKTNGVTPRRWLAGCNPGLRSLLDRTIGQSWVTDTPRLNALCEKIDDQTLRQEWRQIKFDNKRRLAELVKHDCGVEFDIESIFDVQVKRIHEYKRQLLNVLHVVHLYARIKNGDTDSWTPRSVLIGGKAAPGYYMARQIIKLINNVAGIINEDPDVGSKLKLAFLPNYRVTAMEVICAGADLSEQISTAGKEASGTGNMKFMMNGAVTIGTLDGANIEIREEVGDSNFFLFGLTASEVEAQRANYNPSAIIDADADLTQTMALLESGHFNQFEPGIFDAIFQSIRSPHDPWMVAADFRSYIDAQQIAADTYLDTERWTSMSILNTAKSGKFSSDRTIAEYNNDIWLLGHKR